MEEQKLYKPADGACPDYLRINGLHNISIPGGTYDAEDEMFDQGYLPTKELSRIFGIGIQLMNDIATAADVKPLKKDGSSYYSESAMRDAIMQYAPKDGLLSFSEVKRDAYVTEERVISAIEQGIISPSYKVGRFTYFPSHAVHDLYEWVKAEREKKKARTREAKSTISLERRAEYRRKYRQEQRKKMLAAKAEGKLLNTTPEKSSYIARVEPPKGYITGYLASARYNLPSSTIYNLIKKGKLACKKEGRYLFLEEEVLIARIRETPYLLERAKAVLK